MKQLSTQTLLMMQSDLRAIRMCDVEELRQLSDAFQLLRRVESELRRRDVIK
ncbi:hypothetical protein [Zhongshania sp.]|uniref:hypothetical protein n=1 Tax=Zhongshania sp. TaxID=1971902 RepID=UPI0035690CC4